MEPRLVHLSALGAAACLLSGCETRPLEERLMMQGPVHGRAAINYVVASPDGSLDLGRTADVARTIGHLRRLNLSEAEKIQRLAQARFDGFVLQEMKELKPKYETKKRRIRERSVRSIASAPTRAKEIEQKAAAAIAKLDEEIREEAIIAVKRQYGTRVAVPLKTRDRKPAVAISTIAGDRASAPQDAIELDGIPGEMIEHEGERTPVIHSTANLR